MMRQLVALLALVACVAAATVQLSTDIFGRAAINAHSIWDGGLRLTLAATPACNWSATNATAADVVVATPSGAPPALNVTALFPEDLTPFSLAFANDTNVSSWANLTVTLQPQVGFCTNADVVLTVQNSSHDGDCGGTDGTTNTTLRIAANTNGGFAAYTIDARNEYDVQRSGITITATLTYNVFRGSSNPPAVLSSSNAIAGAAWNFTFESPVRLVARMAPLALAQFNVPAGQSAFVALRLFSAADVGNRATFLSVAGPLPAIGNFSITAVDGVPLAFCTPSITTFTAGLLRAGPVVIDLTLSPPGADAFVPNATSAWDGAVGPAPDGVNVSYAVVNSSLVRITFLADDNFTREDTHLFVFSPAATLLQSAAAGCGVVRIALTASPGVATGLDLVNMTEVEINRPNATYQFTFAIAFDRFLPTAAAYVTTAAAPVVLNESLADGENVDFATVANVSTAVSADGLSCVVTVRAAPTLNVPAGVAQAVTIRFPANAMVGSNAPAMANATFFIFGVEPVLTAVFSATNTSEARAPQLWAAPGALVLRLAGDTWSAAALAVARWAPGSPAVASSLGAFASFAANTTAAEGQLYFLYANVTLSDNRRVATLPIRPLVGLAFSSANESVTIGGVAALVSGSANETVTPATLTVRAGNGSDVAFTCGGACSQSDAGGTAVAELAVRERGFWFTIAVANDAFNSTSVALNPAQALSAPADFQPFLSSVVASVAEPRRVVVNITLPPLPLLDIRQQSTLTVQVGAGFLRFFDSQLAGSVRFVGSITVAPAPQPVCSMLVLSAAVSGAFPTSISEGDVRAGNVSIGVTATTSFVAGACEALRNGTLAATLTATQGHALVVAAGNCATANSTFLPLLLLQRADYDIAAPDTLVIDLNMTFFASRQRCNSLTLAIRVQPATANVTFSGVESSSSTTTAKIAERTLRERGTNITIVLAGETMLACHFFVVTTVLQGDTTVTSATNFGSLRRPINMSSADCVVNVSRSATFTGVQPPMPAYDVGRSEIVAFSVPAGINSNVPNVVGGVLEVVPSSELLAPVILFSNASGAATTLTPVFTDVHLPVQTLADGGFLYNLTLAHDAWSAEAVTRLVQFGVTFAMLSGGGGPTAAPGVNATTAAPAAAPGTAVLLSNSVNAAALFPAATRTNNDRTLLIAAPAVPSLFTAVNYSVNFTLVASDLTSGVLPTPSVFGFVIGAGAPLLIVSGPGVNGGTRQLLLGELYLTVTLVNDVFVPESITAADVCPEQFDTCSITIDSTARVLNITFPAQNLVLYAQQTYEMNVTRSNIMSGRNITNGVVMTLNVQSGILSRVELNGAVGVIGGVASVRESDVRDGLISFVRFTLEGDSFVAEGAQVINGLVQGTRCVHVATLADAAAAADLGWPIAAGDTTSFCARIRNILSGAVAYVDRGNQAVNVFMQPDALFDIAASPVAVTFMFTGLATTSAFAPVALTNATLFIEPAQGQLLFSATRASVSQAELRGATALTAPLVFTLSLRGERWNATSSPGDSSGLRALTEAIVAGVTSSLSPSSSTSFAALKSSLFLQVSLSADRRTVTLQMEADARYSAATSETILFANVLPRAVVSGIAPNLVSSAPTAAATFVIEAPSLAVTFSQTPATAADGSAFDAATMRTRGVLLSLALPASSSPSTAVRWNAAIAQSNASLRAAFTSQPAQAAGFSALFSAMGPVGANVTLVALGGGLFRSVLTMQIAPSAQYAIQERETITLHLTPLWTTANTTLLVPTSFSITVEPDDVVVIVLTPNTGNVVASVVGAVATLLGIGEEYVSAVRVAAVERNAAFANVSLRLANTNRVGDRSAAANAQFLVSTAAGVLSSCCNISLAYLAAAPPSERAINAAVGLGNGGDSGSGSGGGGGSGGPASDVIWVAVAAGVLVVASAIGFAFFRYRLGATHTGVSRKRRDEPELSKQRLVLVDAETGAASAQQRKGGSGDDEVAAAERFVEAVGDDEDGALAGHGGFSLGDGTAMRRRGGVTVVDVDDSLAATQPPNSAVGRSRAVASGPRFVPTVPPAVMLDDDAFFASLPPEDPLAGFAVPPPATAALAASSAHGAAAHMITLAQQRSLSVGAVYPSTMENDDSNPGRRKFRPPRRINDDDPLFALEAMM